MNEQFKLCEIKVFFSFFLVSFFFKKKKIKFELILYIAIQWEKKTNSKKFY